jgi:hypothetical protein
MYTRQTWVDLVTDADAAHMNRIEDALAIPVVGDGVADDQPVLQTFVNLVSAAGGGYCNVAPGMTCLLASTLTIPANVKLEMNGSQIKKKSTMTTAAINVTGSSVSIVNLKLDGNKAGGATGEGITWAGFGGQLVNSQITNCRVHGVISTGSLTARNTTSSGHGSVLGDASGFFASGSGLIVTDALCVGNNNTQSGVLLNTTATGCHVDGTFNRNALAGVWVYKGNAGTSTIIIADDNDYQNVTADQGVAGIAITDWKFGMIIASNQGVTGVVTSGSSVEFKGCSRFQCGTIITRGGGGYGLALASGDGIGGTGFGTSDSSFGNVICDNTGAFDTDPGVTLQYGCKRNHFASVSVRGHSRAITISEETAPVGNDNNTFAVVDAANCPYGVIDIRGGNYNTFGRITARDCGNADPTIIKGIIGVRRHDSLGGGYSRGNTFGFLDYKDTRTSGAALTGRALCLVWFDSTESGNRVLDGIARDADTDVIDENGNNSATLRPMQRNALVTSFEEATWSGGTANSTAGQFVEGTSGRRLVSSTTFSANSFRNTFALDLSGMGNDEWFRVFVNVENVSDKHASTPLLFRFADSTEANYFQYSPPPQAILKNGPMYLYMRKGSFVASGTPNWASIARISFYTGSAAANTFALTLDNLERIYPDRYSKHIGGILPYGMPVGSGDMLVATGKGWINDAGTWKSATYA